MGKHIFSGYHTAPTLEEFVHLQRIISKQSTDFQTYILTGVEKMMIFKQGKFASCINYVLCFINRIIFWLQVSIIFIG